MNSKKNILIFEDDVQIKQELETLLCKKGYNVKFLESAREDTNSRAKELKSNHILHDINFSENPHPVLRVSSEGNILYCNEASQALLDMWQYSNNNSLPNVLMQYISETLKKNIIRRFETDFSDIILSLTITPNIEKNYVNIYGFEITERKKLIEALRKSQEIYHNLFNNSEVGMFRTRIDGSEVLNANEKFLKVLGWKREEIIGKPTRMHWADPDQRKELLNRLKVNNRVVDFECKLLNRKKEVRDCLVSLNIYPAEGVLHGSVMDITESKQNEDLLRKSYEDLRNLTAHLDKKIEEEKKKLARKLHDKLGQLLPAIKINCSLLMKEFSEEKVVTNKFIEINELIDNSIQQVQEITKEIRSNTLEDLGIFAAMYSKIHDFEEKYGIAVNMICKPKNFDVDPEISVTIYKIYLELLTNIMRHSQTKKVEIQFKKTKTKLSLIIKDFGIGITKEQISNSFSFGLIGIKERLNIWHGQMKIDGVQDKGTTVKIQIPLLDTK